MSERWRRGLVELAMEKADKSGAARVEAVHVRLGALVGIAEDAFFV